MMTKHGTPPPSFLLWMGFLVIADMIALSTSYFILKIGIPIALFLSIFFHYRSTLTPQTRSYIPYLFLATLFLFLFQMTEIHYCKQILKQYPSLPYHIVVETTGLAIFYFISHILLRIE
jgi:hypothetical protein